MTEELSRPTGNEVAVSSRALLQMAEMIRATNERVTELTELVRRLQKVTPAQAAELNRAVRERAAALALENGLPEGAEKKLAAAIRREIRALTGERTAREISRCDYEAILLMIGEWEDLLLIRALT